MHFLKAARFVQVIQKRNRNLGLRYKKHFPVFHTNLLNKVSFWNPENFNE